MQRIKSNVDESGQLFCNLFPTFPLSELWRLIIDENRQAEGPLAFDEGDNPEEGYLEGVMQGFNLIAGKRPSSDADFLEKLHDVSISKIIETNKVKRIPEINYRNNKPSSFGLNILNEYDKSSAIRSNLTVEGLKELIKFINEMNSIVKLSGNEPLMTLIDKSEQNKPYDTEKDVGALFNELKNSLPSLKIASLSREQIREIIDKFQSDYESEIKSAGDNRNLKLRAIITYVHKLELLHPFTDANCRTFVVLFLNKLLIDNEFSPVILTNPNHFDGYSAEELLADVNEGMKKFDNYCNQCTETFNKLHDVLKTKPFFNKKQKIFNILPKDHSESLYVIEYVYQRLVQDKLHADYLIYLKEIYRDNMLEVGSQLSSAREKKAFVNIVSRHHIADDFKEFLIASFNKPSAAKRL